MCPFITHRTFKALDISTPFFDFSMHPTCRSSPQSRTSGQVSTVTARWNLPVSFLWQLICQTLNILIGWFLTVIRGICSWLRTFGKVCHSSTVSNKDPEVT